MAQPGTGTTERHPTSILVATIVASGMVFLDGTVVNVAIRRIGQELPATLVGTLEAQAYITSGFLAVLAALLILGGALADKYGRRRLFRLGLVGFGLTSVLCGVAPSLEILVVARLIQGASGALLVPGSLSLITASFDGSARGRAFGIWTAATSHVPAAEPPAGVCPRSRRAGQLRRLDGGVPPGHVGDGPAARPWRGHQRHRAARIRSDSR